MTGRVRGKSFVIVNVILEDDLPLGTIPKSRDDGVFKPIEHDQGMRRLPILDRPTERVVASANMGFRTLIIPRKELGSGIASFHILRGKILNWPSAGIRPL